MPTFNPIVCSGGHPVDILPETFHRRLVQKVIFALSSNNFARNYQSCSVSRKKTTHMCDTRECRASLRRRRRIFSDVGVIMRCCIRWKTAFGYFTSECVCVGSRSFVIHHLHRRRFVRMCACAVSFSFRSTRLHVCVCVPTQASLEFLRCILFIGYKVHTAWLLCVLLVAHAYVVQRRRRITHVYAHMYV